MGHLFVKHVPIVFVFIIQQTTTAIEHYFYYFKRNCDVFLDRNVGDLSECFRTKFKTVLLFN